MEIGRSWSSHSWQEKNSLNDKNKNNATKKQKTSESPTSAQKEAIRRKRQAVCYTTHSRGILAVISSFPIGCYGTDKGNYASPQTGDHCDPTTVYLIPPGDLLEHGKFHPETLRGVQILDDSMPFNDIPSAWKEYQIQQECGHLRCTRAAIEGQQFTAERARAEHTAWQNQFKEKDALKLTFDDKVGKAAVTNHGGIELIEISGKQDDPSPNKVEPPISPAAKWHEVGPSSYQKANILIKYERAKSIAADGGLRPHGQDRGLSPFHQMKMRGPIRDIR